MLRLSKVGLLRLVIWSLSLLATAPASAQLVLLGGHSGGEMAEHAGAISTIDLNNANLTMLGTPMPGAGITGIATNSAGRVFATTGSVDANPDGPRLIQIDPATGQLVNDLGRLRNANGDTCAVGDLSFQPGTDVLFGVLASPFGNFGCGLDHSPGGTLVTINTNNARVTVIGRDDAIGNSNGGLAFTPNGLLYFTPCGPTSGALWVLNPANGFIQGGVALSPDSSCYMGLGARPGDGALFGSYNFEQGEAIIARLNPGTGERQVLGETPGEVIHDLTFVDLSQNGPVFVINPGLNDAWYNQATSGQGFFIIVFPDVGIIFMAWFTYDTERPPNNVLAILGEPGHRWLTAQGPYQGDTATLDVYLTQGGIFDMSPPVPQTGAPIGTITIVWHDCESGTLSYDIDPPGVQGMIPIRRIVNDNVALCEALSQP